MEVRKSTLKLALGAGCALAVLAAASTAAAEQRTFSLASSRATDTIPEFARQAGIQIVAPADKLRGVNTRAIEGRFDTREALAMLVEGTGLRIASDDGRTVTLVAADPQGGSAASGGAEVEALIVTAQKREEDIQDVPIAISAFSQEALERSQIAGGPDLMTQVPNMTFTKTNFSSYSIQLRGIGTQAISATTDAAVAVAFNNTPFIRNYFFEQEFYDLQRVEVLRGPQGTLYGRNATAGVVNVISAKPRFVAESKLSGDVSNYNSSRLEGMINIPLVDDKVALRLAGAWTKRNGYVTNGITGNPIDGRDLWSTRISLRVAPTDAIDANLIWEHFEENDDRLRSGKQLCKEDTVEEIGGFPVNSQSGWQNQGNDLLFSRPQAVFSQGCAPSSLYSPDSFSTPNGLSLPYYLPLRAVGGAANLADPYLSRTQSHDLRVIESTVDPKYLASSDLGELQVNFNIANGLTLTSETAYSTGSVFSMQDYNRFNTAPGAWPHPSAQSIARGTMKPGPNGGIFCDPQIGCADRLVAIDLSQAKASQFSQEFRLGSDWDGPLNFSLGANFLRYDNEDKYYVFINSLSIISAFSGFFNEPEHTFYDPAVTDNAHCLKLGLSFPDHTVVQPVGQCTFMDVNPIGSLNDLGHNYFLSKNPYKLISYAAFGELYYNVTDNLKITGGLRWTVDRKEAPRIPSWVIASHSIGYPVIDVIEQEWREPTGRLTIDWKPNLSFTDETLLYGSYAHGYKAGGANPPPTGAVKYCIGCGAVFDLEAAVVAKSATHPKTFEPEFIEAFEVGAKNTLFDNRMTLNLAVFYYDYTGYQISQIVNRSAVNLNFDAEVWGLEIEADWRPLENLRLGFKGGYEGTRVADGMQAVDVMDRTAGNPDWVLVRPFPTFPSNCIAPTALYARSNGLYQVGGVGGGNPGTCELAYVLNLDPVTQQPYNPNTLITGQGFTAENPYRGFDPSTAPNNGEGFYKDLSGNELPNAPTFTATITADYTVPLPNDWLATLHTDLYYQSEAWTRIFNMEGYDKLKAYTNVNLAAIFTNEDAGWKVMAYVKNVLDRDSITGAFLNSDDTGLTTNVFLTEPRLYGLRVTKEWTGAPWLGGMGGGHDGPYPFTLELGGQVQRHDAPYAPLMPDVSDLFPDALDPRLAQNQDLDWGDGREVKFTYAVGGWQISAGGRFGKTNKVNKFHETEAANKGCVTAQIVCAEYAHLYANYGLYFEGPNTNLSNVQDREDHALVDFTVGRELGIGILGENGRSVVRAGLRYAEFKSQTRMDLMGVPDWQIPSEYALFTDLIHHNYDVDLVIDRRFEGFGPTLSWEAAARLFGNADAGHVDLDWSIEGGVLFGKQETDFDGEIRSAYYNGPKYINGHHAPQVGPTVVTSPPESRSQSVTVPTFGASLGLSYEIQRVKIGAGYRWERYFDVLDVGYDDEETADRTIDGPYFKIAVGFGG